MSCDFDSYSCVFWLENRKVVQTDLQMSSDSAYRVPDRTYIICLFPSMRLCEWLFCMHYNFMQMQWSNSVKIWRKCEEDLSKNPTKLQKLSQAYRGKMGYQTIINNRIDPTISSGMYATLQHVTPQGKKLQKWIQWFE